MKRAKLICMCRLLMWILAHAQRGSAQSLQSLEQIPEVSGTYTRGIQDNVGRPAMAAQIKAAANGHSAETLQELNFKQSSVDSDSSRRTSNFAVTSWPSGPSSGTLEVEQNSEVRHECICNPPQSAKVLKSTFLTAEKCLSIVDSISSRRRKRQVRNLVFLDTMFDDYDKRAWPTFGTDEPTDVRVNIYINSFGPVNAAHMEYGMDIYLRQYWKDPRLALNKYKVLKEVALNAEDIAPMIWKPDIFFRNVKEANFHMVTVPNKLIRLSPDGGILYSMRITMKLACQMSFKYYPLDIQKCQIVLGTYAQTTDQVVIRWRDVDPIHSEEPLELPEFTVANMTYSNFTRDIDTGSFSFLNVTFVLVRQNGYHLIQTYMPTFLIVMISWVSFWLNVDATAARVTLGVTTLLTLTTVAYGVRMQLPPVSYVKAIDVWIGTCSVMVFGALLEFTLVNYLSRSKLGPEQFRNSINIFHWNKKLDLEQDHEETAKVPSQMERNLKRARSVDRFCRIVFPSAFTLFNIIYWLYYLILTRLNDD